MADYPAVLYVEDDEMSRIVMQIILVDQMNLSQVVIFEDSTNFVARIEQLPFTPDIIFLDIHMEPIDGFQMLQLLRNHARFSPVTVVALTASVMNEEIDRLRDVGFDGVIPKPIDLENFPYLLDKLLNGESVWRIINNH